MTSKLFVRHQPFEKGGIVGLAPEGTRSKDHKLMQGKPGTTLLALKTKAQVIPAAVLGSADMMNRFLKLKKNAGQGDLWQTL